MTQGPEPIETEKAREERVANECLKLKRRVLEHHGGRIIANLAELMDAVRVSRRLIESRPEAFGLNGVKDVEHLRHMEKLVNLLIAGQSVFMQNHGASEQQLSIFLEIEECSGWICSLCGCTVSEPCVEQSEEGEDVSCSWYDRDLCTFCFVDPERAR